MRSLGPQIITAATAVVSFLAGILADAFRQRATRRAQLQAARLEIYGRYLTATIQATTIYASALSGVEPTEELAIRARALDDIAGPVRLHANEDVERALEGVSRGYFRYGPRLDELVKGGSLVSEAAMQAWQEHMQTPFRQLEQAMKAHLNLP